MQMKFITLLYIFFFLLSVCQINGQTQEYRFEFLIKEDGLSSNHVKCIFQDSFGFIWFGTDKGITRYDGRNFVIYNNNPKDSLSLSHNDVTRIIEEPGTRNLWISTLGGLNYFDRKNKIFKRFLYDSLSNSVSNNVIYDIAYADSTLWIGTQGYLDAFRNGKFTHYKLPPLQNKTTEFDGNIISSILVDDGFLWLGTHEFPIIFDLNSKTLTTQKLYDEVFHATTIDKDLNGNIWFGTSNGPLILKKGHEKLLKFNDLFKYDQKINSGGILEYNDKIFIINRNTGLNVLNLQDSSVLLLDNDPFVPNSISSEALVTGLKSKEGIYWIGTYNSGVNIFDPRRKNFGHYKFNYKSDGLINNNMRSIFLDSEENVWIGTKENGCLSLFNKEAGTFTHFLPDNTNPEALHGDYLFCIDEFDKNNLLIGTLYNGINIFNKQTGKVKHLKHNDDEPERLADNAIYVFKRISPNEILVGTKIGLDIWNAKTDKFKHIDLFRNPRCIFMENEDRIWVGTLRDGIYILDAEYNLVERYVHSPNDSTSIGSNRISSIKRGPDNKIWICTGGGGLNYYVPEKNAFTTLKEKDGLPSDYICEILFHTKYEYWLSTGNGLSVFYPETNTFKNYDSTDGLQGNEFADFVALKLPSGELIFGGLNGFNIFKPEDITDNTFIPNVVFADFYINHEPAKIGNDSPLKQSIEFTDKIVLTHQQNEFGFGFAALNYLTPEKNEYSYKLEGFDKTWLTIPENGEPFVTYSNTPPGNYIFKVKAANNDGYWNEEGAQVALTILPPWWKTFWFRILAIFLLLSLFVLIIYTRFKQYQKRRTELEHLVEQRTRENKEIEAQLIHSEKMASLGVLTAGVAHKINNPLKLIQSGIYRIENTLESDFNFEEKSNRLKTILEHMQIGVDRTSDIVKSLNTFSRKDHKGKEEFDLHTIIDNCLTILNHELKEKCTVKKQYHDTSILMTGNMENLHQVFLNILKNAVQAIEKEGKIKIITRHLNRENVYEIIISDNGKGISEENISKIYDPFFTTKKAGEGLGLGLSIVFKIINDHKGTIKYDSKLNKGTKVTITIPASL